MNTLPTKPVHVEEFLHSILNSVADPVFVKDDTFTFAFANNALCEMLGMSRENIVGKTLGESLPKDQMDHFLANDKKVLDSGNENISEESLTGKDGKILTIVTKKTRYIDENGKKFIVGIIRDITKRKEQDKALAEKVSDLEKMNSVMMGRELKMIEMKKQLEELQKKSG